MSNLSSVIQSHMAIMSWYERISEYMSHKSALNKMDDCLIDLKSIADRHVE